MGITIQGFSTGNGVEADSTNHLLVNTPTLITSAGYVRAVAEIDPGSYIGTPTIRTGKVTMGRNTLVSYDTPYMYENFNYNAQNTADYKYLNASVTVAFAGGYATFNSGSTTAAGEALLQSYRSVPIFSTGAISCCFNAYLTVQPVTNFQCEFGLFAQSGSAPYTPSDGVYFRFTSAGLIGVSNYNGTETTTGVMVAVGNTSFTNPTTYQIILNANKIEFWNLGTSTTIAPTLLGVLYTSLAQPFLSGALPIGIRQLQTGTTSTAVQLKIAWFSAQIHDYEPNKPFPHIMAGDGAMAYQGQNGGTMGTTALFQASGTALTTAVPSNTSAALGSGLGGQFSSTQTLAVNTDGIISSYQNPLGSTTQQPRGLYITGVRIDSVITTTVTGGPPILLWSLAFGHTAVSLATSEGLNTKAPRKISLGVQPFVTLTAGVQAPAIMMTFTTPIYINPGEFIQTVYRNIGTLGTAGVVAHSITFDGYWE